MSYLSELLAKYKNAPAPDIGLINAGVRDHNENAEAHPDVRTKIDADVAALESSVGAQLSAKADVAQEDWITPTLENDTTQIGAYTPGYFKDNFGIVHCKGQVQQRTLNTTLFTFAAGYRPAQERKYICSATNAAGIIRIYTSGVIQLALGTGTSIVLDGLSFRVT